MGYKLTFTAIEFTALAKTLSHPSFPLINWIINKVGYIVNVDLNEHEKTWIDKNPVGGAIGGWCMLGALLRSSTLPGEVDGYGDAMRHCYWGACMARFIGPTLASQIMNAHENGQSNPYDAHNNQVAIKIGTHSLAMDLNFACEAAAKDGTLQYIGSPRPTPSGRTYRRVSPSALPGNRPSGQNPPRGGSAESMGFQPSSPQPGYGGGSSGTSGSGSSGTSGWTIGIGPGSSSGSNPGNIGGGFTVNPGGGG